MDFKNYKYLSAKNGEWINLKSLGENDYSELAAEIRAAILNRVSKIGGHCGSNLGVVEAMIALHSIFDFKKDKLVFDVSHQCYAHKILSGRAYGFICDENFTDIEGYTEPNESAADNFVTGHTSTSIANAIGLAIARDKKKENHKVIAFIGDGSLSGGLALEGLNVAGEYQGQLLIIVNDNNMSIAENHGGLYKNLKELRQTDGKSSNNLFKSFGLEYKFLKDGNDTFKIITELNSLKNINKPVVLHIVTQKGKGFNAAEKEREKYHYTPPFDLETLNAKYSIQSVIGKKTYEYFLTQKEKCKTFEILTSAVPSNLGLWQKERQILGDTYLDVGIAEEAMCSIAAGIAKGGGVPVVFTLSTFFHRAYDQIYHDVCINNLPVLFLIFSGTIFGIRDVTHSGMFCDNVFSNMPNLTQYCPVNEIDYFKLLDDLISKKELKSPVAIKVPENPNNIYSAEIQKILLSSTFTKPAIIKNGSDVCIIAAGDMLNTGVEVAKFLESQNNKIHSTLISERLTSTNIDNDFYKEIAKKQKLIAIIDNSQKYGGFSSKISTILSQTQKPVLIFTYPNTFKKGYDINDFLKDNNLTPDKIVAEINKTLEILKLQKTIEQIL